MLNCFTCEASDTLIPRVTKGIATDPRGDDRFFSVVLGVLSRDKFVKIPVIVGHGPSPLIRYGDDFRLEKVSVRRLRVDREKLEIISPNLEDTRDRALVLVRLDTLKETGTPQLNGGVVELVSSKYRTHIHVAEYLFMIPRYGSIFIDKLGSTLSYKFSYRNGTLSAKIVSLACPNLGDYELV